MAPLGGDKAATVVPVPVLCAYIGFGAVGLTVYHTVAERAVSSTLTMAALAQCLGITLLCVQALASGSAAGISAKSLVLDAVAIVLRLSSTLWLEGYLPVDKSGDYIYQLFDVCSLLLLLFLLHRVLLVQRATYQDSEDSFNIGPMVLGCLGLAAVLHGNMDDQPLFDTFWMAGLFAGVVAVVPQMWLITSSGGRTEALTSHYVAAMAISRGLSGHFMWKARNHITCNPYFGGFEHAIYAILAAHVVHALLLGDFAYYYVKSVVKNGLNKPVEMLPYYV